MPLVPTPWPNYVGTGLISALKVMLATSDTDADVDFNPDADYPQGSTFDFVPSIEALVFPDTNKTIVYLETITGVIGADGEIHTVDGDPLRLPATDATAQIWYYTVRPTVNGEKRTQFNLTVLTGHTSYLSDFVGIQSSGAPNSTYIKGDKGDPGTGISDVRLIATDTHTYAFKSMSEDVDEDVFEIDGVTGEVLSAEVIPPAATTFVVEVDPTTGWTLLFADNSGRAYGGVDVTGRIHWWSRTPILISGDSMVGIAALSNYDPTLAQLLGRAVINQGIGGDWQQWITARMNGKPASVTVLDTRDALGLSGTIPASGSCNVRIRPELGAVAFSASGEIAGIPGVFVPTQKPGSPDPLAANDPGSIAFNYVDGVFTRNRDGIATLVPDGTPFHTRVDAATKMSFRRCWQIIQPSRHIFKRRYMRLTMPMAATGGYVKLGVLPSISTGQITWVQTPASIGTVTFSAATDRATVSVAHGLAIGDQVVFTGSTIASIVDGTVYTVHAVPTGTTLTFVGPNGSGEIDITADGTATAIRLTAESAFAKATQTAIAAALGAAWTGSVTAYSNLPTGDTTPGVIEMNWGVADTPAPFVIAANALTGTTTLPVLDLYRTGIDDGLAGIAAILSSLTSDARAHTIVLDIGPFPGEENGTANRVLLDAYNDALRRAFKTFYYPLWALMRNLALITGLGYTPMTNGAPTQTNDDAYAISIRMTPPTWLDQGGGTFSGGHPGPAGAVARGRLILDLISGMNDEWREVA